MLSATLAAHGHGVAHTWGLDSPSVPGDLATGMTASQALLQNAKQLQGPVGVRWHTAALEDLGG